MDPLEAGNDQTQRETLLRTDGLAVLTVCAASYQLMASQPANAIFALIIGAIAAFVAYNRRNPAPRPSVVAQSVPVVY